MERPPIDPSVEPTPDSSSARSVAEADAVRLARLQRDVALSPNERLDKLAALCRQADLLRGARHMS